MKKTFVIVSMLVLLLLVFAPAALASGPYGGRGNESAGGGYYNGNGYG
jgi:hypothetical protein